MMPMTLVEYRLYKHKKKEINKLKDKKKTNRQGVKPTNAFNIITCALAAQIYNYRSISCWCKYNTEFRQHQ